MKEQLQVPEYKTHKDAIPHLFTEAYNKDAEAYNSFIAGYVEVTNHADSYDKEVSQMALHQLDILHADWAQNRTEMEEKIIGMYRLLALNATFSEVAKQPISVLRQCFEHNGVEILTKAPSKKYSNIDKQYIYFDNLHKYLTKEGTHDEYTTVSVPDALLYDREDGKAYPSFEVESGLRVINYLETRVKSGEEMRQLLKDEALFSKMKMFTSKSNRVYKSEDEWSEIEKELRKRDLVNLRSFSDDEDDPRYKLVFSHLGSQLWKKYYDLGKIRYTDDLEEVFYGKPTSSKS